MVCSANSPKIEIEDLSEKARIQWSTVSHIVHETLHCDGDYVGLDHQLAHHEEEELEKKDGPVVGDYWAPPSLQDGSDAHADRDEGGEQQQAVQHTRGRLHAKDKVGQVDRGAFKRT